MAGSKKGGGGDVVLESRHLVGLFVLMVAIFGVVFLLGYELGRNQYGDQVRASSSAPEEGSAANARLNAKASASQPAASSQPTAAQPAGKKSAAVANPKDTASNATPDVSSGPPVDYDFYKLGQPNQPPAHLAPPPKAVVTKPAPKSSAPTISVPSKPSAPPPSTVKAQPPASSVASSGKSQSGSMSGPLIPHGSILLQVSAMTKESDALLVAQQLQQKKFPTIVIPPGADKFYHVQVGPYSDPKAADAARAALEKAGFKSIVKR